MPYVAAIDVGSNATRLSIAEVKINNGKKYITSVDMHRYPLRLGTDVFANGTLSSAVSAALLHIFQEIAALLRQYRIQKYRAVATSAMREAHNAKHIVQDIFQKTAVRIDIISGTEESHLSHTALLQALQAHMSYLPSDVLFMDLGGGSLELICAKNLHGQSYPLGVLRLLEHYPALKTALTNKQISTLRQKIIFDVHTHVGAMAQASIAVGTGGNIHTLQRLLPIGSSVELPQINLAALDKFSYDIAAMTVDERVRCYNISAEHADVILPAVWVVLAMIELCHITTLYVPGVGLRNAIIQHLVDTL